MIHRILLADDHPMFREALRALLDREGFEVVAEAADGRDAVRCARERHPEVAVLDMNMPQMNGLDAAREIRKLAPATRVVLLTMFEDDEYVLQAMRAGIRGYVLKAQAAGDLVAAINAILRGAVYLSPGISEIVVNAYRTKTDLPADPLTDREHQVLQLIAEGMTTKEAAKALGLSVKTADSHRTRIMHKLGIHHTAGLVRYAIRRGVIRA